LGIVKFFARNQLVNGEQVVIALIEGDEGQLSDFKKFAEVSRPEGAHADSVAFEEYDGPIMSVDSFLHFFTADQLGKGIPALLRIDSKQDKALHKQDEMLDKQDKMLEKQDKMLDKQDKMLEKQDEIIEKIEMTGSDIVREIKTTGDEVVSKLDENREAIVAEIGDQKVTLDDRLKRIEDDISKLKAKVGI
jgi:predicted phage tail protein